MRYSSSLEMSNYGRSRRKLAAQTVTWVRINLIQHTKPCNMTSITQRQETLIRAKPEHRMQLALQKLKLTFSGWPPCTPENNTHGLWEEIHNYQRSDTDVYNLIYASPTIKYKFSERHTKQIPRTWPSKVSLLSNFATRMTRLGQE